MDSVEHGQSFVVTCGRRRAKPESAAVNGHIAAARVGVVAGVTAGTPVQRSGHTATAITGGLPLDTTDPHDFAGLGSLVRTVPATGQSSPE
jgi:hypothetical protein